jgi:hypothetical protein
MTFRRPQLFTRYAAGAYVAGRFQPGSPLEIQMNAGVQPLTGKKQITLPEGKRIEDSIIVYTNEEVFPAKESQGIAADRLAYRGAEYECISCEPWQSGVAPHFKSIFSKVGQ